MPFSFRIYRWLTRLYPPRFREEFGSALEAGFRDEYREAAGTGARLRLWTATLADLLVSVPGLFAREIGRDARQTFRLWARRPFHTGLAILALAIGIGANTGVFSVLNALLLRSLPFHEPDRLAAMRMFNPAGIAAKPGSLRDWRRKSTYMEDAAQFGSLNVNLANARNSERIHLTETSANFFSLLGTRPALGRAFTSDEDTPGKDGVAVVGYGLWQQLYGGDPRVLGSTIRANGAPLVIVGVAPPNFDYPDKTAIWTPTAFDVPRIPKTEVYFVQSVGRLKPGISWQRARSAFEAEAFRVQPRLRSLTGPNLPALLPLEDQLAGPVKEASLVLMGGVALILLLACINVAHFLLARSVDRSNELLIRSALGAGTARLTQQILTESLLLSAVAALVGTLVAYWTTAIASAVQPAPLSAQTYTLLDWRVLGFTVALSCATGLIFGVLPSIHVSRLQATPSFLRGVSATPRASHWRRWLIAGQVALSLVLLAGSVVIGRAFLILVETDTGYDTAHVVTAKVSLAGTTHEGSDRAPAYYREVLRRVREAPGVQSASSVEYLPLSTSMGMGGQFHVDQSIVPVFAMAVYVAPGFFSTMGVRVIYGREFRDSDETSSEPLVIVNEQFARLFSDPSGLLGRRLNSLVRGNAPYQIIGVVHNIRYSAAYVTAGPQVFLFSKGPRFTTIVARVGGRADAGLARFRAAIQSVDSSVPVFEVETMEQRLDEALARPRFYTTAILFFGGFSLLLAAIGIYAIASYTVAQRRQEIGIRLALGTTAPRLRGRLIQQGLLTVGYGAIPGVAGALAVSRYLSALLPGAQPVSFRVCAAALAPICVVAAAGIWSATRRIARLSLADVLRAE